MREALPDREQIKTIHVVDSSSPDRARTYAPYVDRLLLDSRTKDRLGGTGKPHDWSISRKIVAAAC